MSSKIEYLKAGTKIQCDTSIQPRPTVQQSWPVPTFPSANNSYLNLSLVDIAQSGSKGVQVLSTCTLPGPAGTWTLFWMAYQGSAPTNPTWQAVPIPTLNINMILYDVMASATFVAYLQQISAGQTITYAQALLSTSPNADQSPDGLSNADKIILIQLWNQALGVQSSLNTQAAIAGVSTTALTTAMNSLSNGLIAAGAPSNWATLWPDGTNFRVVGIAGSLSLWWKNISIAQDNLRNAIGAMPLNADCLSNADKIQLIAQWKAEAASQTSLDAQAVALSMPNTSGTPRYVYDASVTALSSNLIAAGAPSNWATIWPDGTTWNCAAIKAYLSTWWSTIAGNRATFIAAISQAQATISQNAAIATAASNALAKMNVMGLQNPNTASWAYASKPSLPNGTYPAGSCWLTTDGKEVQVNSDGTLWQDVVVAATGLFGQLVASQLTVANFDNLVSNPTSNPKQPNGMAWPTGSYEAAGMLNGGGGFSPSGYYRAAQVAISGNSGNTIVARFPIHEGELYSASCMGMYGSTITGDASMALLVEDNTGAVVTGIEVGQITSSATSGQTLQAQYQIPGGIHAAYLQVVIRIIGAASGTWCYFSNFYVRRCSDASMIVDGTITSLFSRFGNNLASTNNNHGLVSSTVSPSGIYLAGQPFTTTFNQGTITAGNFIVGQQYQVVSVGTTNWADGGAYTSWVGTAGAIGSIFTSLSAGSGTGTVYHVATDCVMEAGGSFNLGGLPIGQLGLAKLLYNTGYGGSAYQTTMNPVSTFGYTNGNWQWNAPKMGVSGTPYQVLVTLIGGGAGGANGGGGAGAMVRFVLTVTDGTVLYGAVGAGGLGATTGSVNGAAGATTCMIAGTNISGYPSSTNIWIAGGGATTGGGGYVKDVLGNTVLAGSGYASSSPITYGLDVQAWGGGGGMSNIFPFSMGSGSGGGAASIMGNGGNNPGGANYGLSPVYNTTNFTGAFGAGGGAAGTGSYIGGNGAHGLVKIQII